MPSPKRPRRRKACALLAMLLATGFADVSRGAEPAAGDTALIVAVDVSDSVDEARYRLQMDGIAAALEDPGVIAAITGGRTGGIQFSMIAWADRSDLALNWRRIASKEDAIKTAAEVRGLKRFSGEFTCVARMFRHVREGVLSNLPATAARVVLDVSGDGVENCGTHATVDEARDALVAQDVTINGLPIIEDDDRIVGAGAYRAPGNGFDTSSGPGVAPPLTLAPWYAQHVIGGTGAFILPAHGYADFGRAMRQKFVVEISAAARSRLGG